MTQQDLKLSALIIASSTLLAACGGGGYDISHEAARKRYIDSNGQNPLNFHIECRGKDEGLDYKELWSFNGSGAVSWAATSDSTWQQGFVGELKFESNRDSMIVKTRWRKVNPNFSYRTEYLLDRNSGKMTYQLYKISNEELNNLARIDYKYGEKTQLPNFTYSCGSINEGYRSSPYPPTWYEKAKERQMRNRRNG